MTSINAIRFNDRAGAMICDENRHWNDERMKSLTTDKIRSIVPDHIMEEQGLAAAYGNTGTSSIGEEIRVAARRRVEELYGEALEKNDGPPASFLSMFELAETVFSVQTDLKHRHIDEQIRGRFGFDTLDFCAGAYDRDGESTPIAQPDVIDTVQEMITWEKKGKTTRPVFGNSGLVAGYSTRDGFQLFHFSLTFHLWRPVGSPFVALGSGSDSANYSFLNWARDLSPEQRKGDIDKVTGTMAAVRAINAARDNNLGVDGYFKLLLIDGEKKGTDRLNVISDHRSKLLAETEAASSKGLLPARAARTIFEQVAFENATFEQGLELLWAKAGNRAKLDRFLRGYVV